MTPYDRLYKRWDDLTRKARLDWQTNPLYYELLTSIQWCEDWFNDNWDAGYAFTWESDIVFTIWRQSLRQMCRLLKHYI